MIGLTVLAVVFTSLRKSLAKLKMHLKAFPVVMLLILDLRSLEVKGSPSGLVTEKPFTMPDFNAQLNGEKNLFFPQAELLGKDSEANADPVIFQKLPEVHLTRAKYNVNAYVNYMTVAETFDSLINALTDLSTDVQAELANQDYPDELIQEEHQVIYQNGNAEGSRIHQYGSQLKAVSSEIEALKRNVVSSKREFLESFHTQFLKSGSNRGTRPVLNDKQSSLDPPPTKRPFETQPKTEQGSGQKSKRNIFKSIWDFVFGSSDSQNLKTLQSNVKRLAENGLLRDQYISKMTDSINLLQEAQRGNKNYLSELSEDFMTLNSTLSGVTREVKLLRIDKEFIFQMLHFNYRLNSVQDGYFQAQLTVASVRRYLDAVSRNEMTPSMVSPDRLYSILSMVENNLLSRPNLALPLPKEEVFEYYKLLEVTSIIQGHYLFIMVSLPLIYPSLSLTIYQVHNLPYYNEKLDRYVSYDITENLFAISKDGQYLTYISESEAHSCISTRGRICKLTTALYATDNLDSCVYSVFMNNEQKIKNSCNIVLNKDFSKRIMLLDENLYYVTLKGDTKIQISCVRSVKYKILRSPFTFVMIPPGCVGTADDFQIIGTNSLSSRIDGSDLIDLSNKFTASFEKTQSFRLTEVIDFRNFTKRQISNLREGFNSTDSLEKLSFNTLNDKVQSIDENYEKSMSTWLIVLIAVICTIVFTFCLLGTVYLRHKGYLKYSTDKTSTKTYPQVLYSSETVTTPPTVTIFEENDRNNTKATENKTETDGTEKEPIRDKVKNQVRKLNDLDKEQEEAMQFLEQTYHADFSKYKNYRSKKSRDNRYE